jgi:hypothetical protein
LPAWIFPFNDVVRWRNRLLSAFEINVGRDRAAVLLDLLRDIYLADLKTGNELSRTALAQNEVSRSTMVVARIDTSQQR